MELTIGIPVYKNVDTLNTALKSIATQKNKEVDCKVIISEDFSTNEKLSFDFITRLHDGICKFSRISDR